MQRPTLMRPYRAVAAAAMLAACGDSSTEPRPTPAAELAVVVNSVDRSLTVIPVDSPQSAFTIGLAPDGSPVNVAARGARAVVPLGTVPAAAVADLIERRVVFTVALPENSGATGAAFVNDSIVIVGNPGRNTVSPVNVLRGTRGDEIPVGVFPQAVVAVGDTAFVLNAELGPDFQPAGPGTVSVITGTPLQVVRTITLSGTNPGAAAAGSTGLLYVINAGRFGQGEGSVSVIHRNTLEEIADQSGFGDFPGSAAFDAASGRLFVGSFAYGVAVWDAAARAFVRAPAEAVQPGGIGSTAGVGVDSRGRLYALLPECTQPSVVFRLDAAFQVEREIPAGICPFGIAFTTVPAPDA